MPNINLMYIRDLCENRDLLLAKLQEWKLIPNSVKCSNCGNEMILSKSCDRIDGMRWICNGLIEKYAKRKRVKCNQKQEIRKGTFFERSHLSIFKILGFVNFWVKKVSIVVAADELEVSSKTLVDWASFNREVVFAFFFDRPIKLGGKDKIVEIDESKFGKRKYHRGRLVEGQWVFGGYERGTGRVFMVPVDFRGADTLIPIIEKWIEPGTTIISDFWKAYDCLNLKGYQHLKVNHSINFVDPDTGAHTNSIESSWRAAKDSMSASGRKKSSIAGNLARYMFFKRCKELKLDPVLEFCKMAGQVYPGVAAFQNEISDDYAVDIET